MKSYTRRKSEIQEISEVQGLCRLCLVKPEAAVPIFDSENECSALALRIMTCVGFEVSKENNLPNQICMNCHKELDRSYAFRKKCEISYQRLKSHVQAIKKKEAIKAAEIQKKTECSSSNSDKNNDIGEPPNIAFMVNLNGSIQLCEKISLVNNDLQKASLLKSNYFETETEAPERTFIKELLPSEEILQREVYAVPAAENPVLIERNNEEVANVKDLLNYIEVNSNIPVTSVIERNTKEAQTNTLLFNTEGFTNILSRILLGLGVISEDANNLIINNESRTIELEMGDESQLTFELVEEDDTDEMIETVVELPSNNTMHKAEELPKDTSNCNSKDTNNKKNMSIRGQVLCSLCRKLFGSRSVLTRHVRDVHKRERTHACDTCGKRFAQMSVLRRHKLVHAEKRPYQCADCPKSFTQRGSLETHARCHAPSAAPHLHIHKCPKCPKVFLYSSGVSRHMLVHTNKTFKCGSCFRPFKDRSSLQRHMKIRKHQEQPTNISKQ